MPLYLGITGSIGMGKTTVSSMFADLGCPVWDADATVHQLYGRGGAAVIAFATFAPQVIKNGAISRERLRAEIARDDALLPQVEAAIHPLLKTHREHFIAQATHDVLVFDIPLLFETHAEDWLDQTAVVSAPEAVQRERVLARQGMTPAHFELISSKQMPDAEKRCRADYVIETVDLERTKAQVEEVLQAIRGHDG